MGLNITQIINYWFIFEKTIKIFTNDMFSYWSKLL